MKKIIFALFSTSLLFLLTGCGEKNAPPADNSQTQITSSSAATDSQAAIIQAVTKLLAEKYKKSPADLHVVLLLAQGNYARGGVDIKGDETGAMFLAKKDKDWQLVFDGMSSIPCSVKDQGFPAEMVADCGTEPGAPPTGGTGAPGSVSVPGTIPVAGGKTEYGVGLINKELIKNSMAPNGQAREHEETKIDFDISSLTSDISVPGYIVTYKCTGRVGYLKTKTSEKMAALGAWYKTYTYNVARTTGNLEWCRLAINQQTKSYELTASLSSLPIASVSVSCLSSKADCSTSNAAGEESISVKINGAWQAGQKSVSGKTTDAEGWKIDWNIAVP